MRERERRRDRTRDECACSVERIFLLKAAEAASRFSRSDFSRAISRVALASFKRSGEEDLCLCLVRRGEVHDDDVDSEEDDASESEERERFILAADLRSGLFFISCFALICVVMAAGRRCGSIFAFRFKIIIIYINYKK